MIWMQLCKTRNNLLPYLYVCHRYTYLQLKAISKHLFQKRAFGVKRHGLFLCPSCHPTNLYFKIWMSRCLARGRWTD